MECFTVAFEKRFGSEITPDNVDIIANMRKKIIYDFDILGVNEFPAVFIVDSAVIDKDTIDGFFFVPLLHSLTYITKKTLDFKGEPVVIWENELFPYVEIGDLEGILEAFTAAYPYSIKNKQNFLDVWEPYLVYLESFNECFSASSFAKFKEYFIGKYSRLGKFAKEYIKESGWLNEAPSFVWEAVDWGKITRTMESEGHIIIKNANDDDFFIFKKVSFI